MMYNQNGANDEPESEREDRQAWEAQWEIPDELPAGELDPWEGWGEEMCGPEYWLNKRASERGEL